MAMINVGADISHSTNSLVVRSSMSLRIPPSSNRILDIPCKVCGDNSSGKHYNIFACDGCAGFFKRSIRKSRQYECKGKIGGSCVVDKTHRNQCRACRLLKCQEAGMNKEAVQHERGPRNSTIKRQQQMVQIYSDATPKLMLASPPQPPVLNLSLANPGFRPPFMWNPSASIFGSPYRIPFWAPPTPPQAKVPNPRDICETAAGILFFNVKWAKKIQTFTDLPLPDQLLMLEDSWRDLFILGAAQYLGVTELGVMANAYATSESNPTLVAKLKTEVAKFQNILNKIAQYNVDAHELTCLRAMALFKNSLDDLDKNKVLENPAKIKTEHENSQLMLNKYTLTAQPLQPLRFGQLLLLLPELKTVSASAIEDLFFRNTIGNVPIVNVILNVYQAPDL